MTARNLFKDITLLEPLFEEYHLQSGLKLHFGKSVIVPLSNIAPDVLRDKLQASGSSWAGFAIKLSAKYLGYMMGPERGESGWSKSFEKFVARAKVRGNIGGAC